MPAERQISFDSRFHRHEATILKPRDLSLRERFEGDIRERSTPPESNRLPQQLGCAHGVPAIERAASLFEKPLEQIDVDAARLKMQRIAGPVGDEQPVAPALA
jgi:hypothetical protein